MKRESGFRITHGKGFHVTFKNGWTVSVQFGPGNYCEHRDCHIPAVLDGRRECEIGGEPTCGASGSYSAEVAAWGPDHRMISFGDDTVRGWQAPAAVLALLNAAANGDLAAGRIPPEERFDREPIEA